ncbi:MAG: hypothetical protein AMXMBFR34_13130 [Myxococcaceae bacterium]
MATAPLQPIPDSTQGYVDRVLGAQLGDYRVQEKAGEGRWGTLYLGAHASSGQPVTIQVLRSELTGHDEEVKAANSIRCAEIATVTSFGNVPDGRRYRIFARLDGESLAQVLDRRGKLSAEETALLLARIAKVLEAAHAWGIAHGCLGPSSVFVVGEGVKVIDFGLSKQPATPEGDLKALGALGFALLTGQELDDKAPPPLGQGIPELLDRLLRELWEKRLGDATGARRELEGLKGQLGEVGSPALPVPVSQPPKRRGWALVVTLGVVLLGGGGLGAWWWLGQAEPVNAENDDNYDFEAAAEEEAEAAEEASVEPPGAEQPGTPETTPSKPRPIIRRSKPVRSVPSAKALSDEIGRLEAKLRKQTRPGDDVDQALFMLNKQRLRLTGDPSVEDRRDVARQLAGWRRSYLRR